MTSSGSPAATARALFEAFVARDRERAAGLLADDFTFTSPWDDAIDREAWFARCWPGGDRFAAFVVERVAADGHGAFVTYAATTHDGLSFRNTEHLTVRDGTVTRVEVYFGASWRQGRFVPQDEL